jgi:hypothetical protein
LAGNSSSRNGVDKLLLTWSEIVSGLTTLIAPALTGTGTVSHH